jgi:putative ABC transport system permease protein
VIETEMTGLIQDFRYAVRSLAKDHGVAIVAVLTLALGIGAATVIFSVFYNVLVDSFPYKNFDRLITFSIQNLTNNGSSSGRRFFSTTEFLTFNQENRVFEDMVGYDPGGGLLYNDGTGTRSLGTKANVTTNTFAFYGVPALIGRGIAPEDGKPGATPVFVMNYGLWRAEFGGDPQILGTTFVLDGQPRTLIGIMPAKFNLYGVNVWIPAAPDTATLQIIGRLKPGVGQRTAAADLDVIAHRLTKAEPAFVLNPERYAVVTRSFVDLALGDFQKTIYSLLAAVLLLLLIACSNIANLLLARATVREREIAMRSALGASRGRLFRQLLVESFMLSAAACVAGCALAHFSLKMVVAFLPPGAIPPGTAIKLNATVLLFSLTVTVGTSLICGLAPALHAVRGGLHPRVMGSGNAVGGHRWRTSRDILVVTEVGLSIVLLVGAGLMMRSVLALSSVDLPFNPANILYARLALPHGRYYSKPDRKPAFFQQVLPRIQALPGVVSVTQSLMLPPNEGAWTDIAIPGKPHTARWVVDVELCSAGYFQTLGLQLLRGRLLSESDVELSRHVVVVNETLVRQYLGDADPIGQKIKFETFDRPFVDAPHNTYFEIVGVVKDFKTRPERRQYVLRAEAFLPGSVAAFGYPISILAKTAGDPQLWLKSVSRELWNVDPEVAVSASGSIEDFLKDEFKVPRFEFATLAGFAGIGLMFVVIGVFSVMGYAVSLQTQQIGVRMALGANQSNILAMVLLRGLALVTTGILIGVCASLGLTRLVASQIWGISPTDTWTFATVVASVLTVGVAATYIPALRASRVDPMVALRYE